MIISIISVLMSRFGQGEARDGQAQDHRSDSPQNSKKGNREKTTKATEEERWVWATLPVLFKTWQCFCKYILLFAELS